MAFFKQNSARHRAATASHAVRNTTIAAAAGAAVLGSVAPAQAYAEVPAASTGAGAVYATPASSSLAAQTSYTYEAPAATPAPAPAPAAPSAGLAVQSNDTVEIASTASSGGIVGTAMQGLGSGYVYGGTAFGAWDCSGFTQWVFAQQGVDLPRTTWSQFAASTPVASPQPGDLVSQNGGAHVGIYIGGGKMISALNPTQGTQIHSVNAMPVDGYYRVG
ncbi:NlpC/P60 family protein [Kocuria flava]|uniref:C40 family peptidase n=1 Tax=Kocuria flava TaxID=446860 RepID=UPI001FF2BA36|nr:NlpC/P60 family protein [Kocuria flava]MCJ8505178.1 NlpC/P60 family protein [Kocuria flava]